MVRVLLLAFGVVLVSASPTAAQPWQSALCSLEGQTKIFGCIDLVLQDGAFFEPKFVTPTVTQSAPTAFAGWSLSCHTKMQPSSLLVYVTAVAGNGRLRVLQPGEYEVHLRLKREDVRNAYTRACEVETDYWGYHIVIKAGILPVGQTTVALVWTDPTLPAADRIGVSHQQTRLNVTQ